MNVYSLVSQDGQGGSNKSILKTPVTPSRGSTVFGYAERRGLRVTRHRTCAGSRRPGGQGDDEIDEEPRGDRLGVGVSDHLEFVG